MASPEPAAQPSLPQEASTAPAAAAELEAAPQEPAPEAAAAPEAEAEPEKVGGAEEEEEEEGECGFCLYMKAGGCKDAFVAWEECVEAAQKEGDDMVERCYEATSNLKKCMDAHADYYAPVLQAEQAVNERAEAEAEAAAEKDKAGEPASDAGKKEEPASDAEKKEEAVPQQDAPSPPAAGEGEKGEAVAEKA
ncbi:hypothetical protein BS78_02G038300 [Paspalum vaginatum]|nr:hypothetical protein BS78_02G038300 [Paspalum vaginatum]